MQIDLAIRPIYEQSAQAIVISLFEGGSVLSKAAAAVDSALGGQIHRLLENGDFRGKRNEVLVLYSNGALPAHRVILVGLGAPAKLSVESIRQAAAVAAIKARDLGVTKISMELLGSESGILAPEVIAEAMAEGAVLGVYRFRELKTLDADVRPDVESVTVVEPNSALQAAIEGGLRTGQILADSTCMARDLINRPGNIVTPTYLANLAGQLAESCGMKLCVIEREEMKALGMGALLAVAQGSAEPPKLIVLEHNAGRTDLPTIALVGKGLTFDSGGISIKPSEGMEAMKNDMGGGAAVLGAMRSVALLNLPLHVVGLVPASENMPDGLAYRPGDILRSMKGITIEVISTDAEGRLILADALTYSGNFKPDVVVDIATLTGACVVALGHHAAGVMGDDELTAGLREAGEMSGDRAWPLPLYDEYGEQIKSDYADLKNTGGRPGGSLTAGMFLSKFVPEGVRWAHVDMAGTATEEKGRPYTPRGGSGYGVRLLVRWLRNWRA